MKEPAVRHSYLGRRADADTPDIGERDGERSGSMAGAAGPGPALPGVTDGSALQRDEQRSPGLSLLGSAGGVLVLSLWVILFSAGILIDSTPYRARLVEWTSADRVLSGGVDVLQFLAVIAITIVTYTPTSVAILCSVAGVIGVFGRYATLDDGFEAGSALDRINPYLSGLLRGFLIYLVVISGVLIVIEDPFGSPSQGQYIRLAGLFSLLSFLASYNPRFFGELLRRAGDTIQSRATATRVISVRGSKEGSRDSVLETAARPSGGPTGVNPERDPP